MSTRILVTTALVSLAVACEPGSAARRSAASKGPESLAFKFDPANPLTYAMKMRVDMTMDMRIAEQPQKTNMVCEFRWHVTLTPKTPPKRAMTPLVIKASDMEGDWDITGPGGHIVMKLRGEHMTGTRDGTTFMDTAKDIGIAEATQIKKELAALHLTGEMDLDSRGRMGEIRGDEAFVKFWTDSMEGQCGFFGIVFPETPITVKKSWTESMTMKKMGQLQLEGRGLRCKVTFTRQPDETVQGKKIKVFSVSAPFSEKDLTATMDQLGQQIRLKMTKFDRRATGKVRFDAEHGILVDSVTKGDVDAKMSAAMQEQSFDMDMHLDLLMELRHLKAGGPEALSGHFHGWLDAMPDEERQAAVRIFGKEAADYESVAAEALDLLFGKYNDARRKASMPPIPANEKSQIQKLLKAWALGQKR